MKSAIAVLSHDTADAEGAVGASVLNKHSWTAYKGWFGIWSGADSLSQGKRRMLGFSWLM